MILYSDLIGKRGEAIERKRRCSGKSSRPLFPMEIHDHPGQGSEGRSKMMDDDRFHDNDDY